jgi:hypothetical protein
LAATVIDSLILELGIDAKEFQKGEKAASESLKKTREEAEKHGKGIEEAGAKAAAAINKIATEALGLFAVLIGANSIKQFVADLTESNAALGRLAYSLNASPQTLAAWGMAVERIGGNAATTMTSIQGLSDKLYDLHVKGKTLPEMALRLQAEGHVNIDTEHGPMKAIEGIAANLKAVAAIDPARASYLGRQIGLDQDTVTLMIKHGDQIGAVIEKLKRLGPTQADIDAAQKLQSSWAELKQEAVNLGREVMRELDPGLQAAADAMIKWNAANGAWIASGISGAIKAEVAWIEFVITEFDNLTKAIGDAQYAYIHFFHLDTILGVTPAHDGQPATENPDSWGGRARKWFGEKIGAPVKKWYHDQVDGAAPADTGGPRTGGSRSYNNNNPGNIKFGAWAKEHGATGADEKGFAIFPDEATGRKAQRGLWERGDYAGLTVEEAARKWSEGGYGAGGLGVDPGKKFSDLDEFEKQKVLARQRKREGWFGPGSAVGRGGRSDAMAPAGTSPQEEGTVVVTSKGGARFRVASEFAENFKGFIDDYEAAGGVIGPNHGGLGERKGNASYHPIGRAIDVNQIGRNVRAGGVTLPQDVEDALAKKWGLRSGASFSSPDGGHFEVNDATRARGALGGLRPHTGAHLRDHIHHHKSVKSTTSSETHVGTVIVHTAATDANGIAQEIGPAIKRNSFASLANAGPS